RGFIKIKSKTTHDKPRRSPAVDTPLDIPTARRGKQMCQGANHRRMTGAQLDLRDWAPAPCHPALRFSGIICQLFCVRTASPTFGLELIGPADPAINARRIPKNGVDR